MSSSVKSWIFLGLWSAGLLFVSFFPFRFRSAEQPQGQSSSAQQSVFGPFFYYVTKQHQKQLFLTGETMTLIAGERGDVVSPKGESFNQEGQAIPFAGKTGSFWSAQQRVRLEGDAEVHFEQMDVFGDLIVYETSKDEAVAQNRVKTFALDPETRDKVTIYADRLKAYPQKEVAHYWGAVSGEVERPQKYEYKTKFKSEELHFYWQQRQLNLQGNVYIERGNLETWGDRGELFLDHFNKKLKYYVLYDDVRLKERLELESGEQVRRAFGEKLEGIAATGEMILTGTPRVLQDGDELRGYRIILREQSGLIEVDDSNSTFKRIQ